MGWRRLATTPYTHLSLRELDNQVTPLFVLAVTTAGDRLISYLCGDNLNSALGGWVVARGVFMVRRPRGSYVVNPLLSLEVATPGNKSIIRRGHPYARKSASKTVLSRCSSPFVRLVQHPTALGAWCLVHAMSARLAITHRAPSRHCGDARVHGHTTTAIHDIEDPPSWTNLKS